MLNKLSLHFDYFCGCNLWQVEVLLLAGAVRVEILAQESLQ